MTKAENPLNSNQIPLDSNQSIFKKCCTYLGIGVKKNRKDRIWEIDFIRGFCIILMLYDHFMFDVGFVFSKAWIATGNETLIAFVNHAKWYWKWDLRLVVQDLVLISFFTICGISCSFSRSNLKRAIVIGICAGLVSLVTYYMNMFISFGVLHMLSVAVFVWWLTTVILKNKNHQIIAAMSLALIVLALDIYFDNADVSPKVDLFFINKNLAIGSITSADYFPLVPYTAFVFLGAGLGPMIYKSRTSKMKSPIIKKATIPITFTGKYAIFFYLFHQILITAILALISFYSLTPGNFVVI